MTTPIEAAVDAAWQYYSKGIWRNGDWQKTAFTAALEAYEAAKWQTMEGAPRDGTRIVTICGRVVWWTDQNEYNMNDEGEGIWEGAWVDKERWSDTFNPTHWQHLPKGPTI